MPQPTPHPTSDDATATVLDALDYDDAGYRPGDLPVPAAPTARRAGFGSVLGYVPTPTIGTPVGALPTGTALAELAMLYGHEVGLDGPRAFCLGCVWERADPDSGWDDDLAAEHEQQMAAYLLVECGDLPASAVTVFCRLADTWPEGGTLADLLVAATAVAAPAG